MLEKLNYDKQKKSDIVEKATRFVCPARVKKFEQLGVVPVMAKRAGNYFWDMDGKKLFDVHINGGTYNLGHSNPEIVETLREALSSYDIGNHHFVSVARTQLAETLITIVHGNMQYCVFTNSGAEAIEVSIRTARKATSRRKIISFEGAYHGHSSLALRAGYSDQATYFLSDQPNDEFIQVPFNDEKAMEVALQDKDIAAVVCEIIPATKGFLMPSPDYYKNIKRMCETVGTLFVADEVQTGLGRTGKIWACEGYGIKPDMLVTGKGLGGGIYPIAACVISDSTADWIREDGWGYSSTTGGSELGCVVALKVIEIIRRPGVLENVRAMSELLSERLQKIKADHPFLVEIRQNGLIFGLKFDNEYGGALMAACCFECGLWAFPAGFDQSVLQFKPNLLVTEKDCQELLELLENAIVFCEKTFLAGT